MTGAITDPPAGFPTPFYVIGICDECLSVKEFPSEKARDMWEKFHPHQEVS